MLLAPLLLGLPVFFFLPSKALCRQSSYVWESIVVLAMVVLGGIGHIPGVILGAVLLTVLSEILRGIAQPLQPFLFGHVVLDVEIIRQLIYGLVLILIMLYRPGGIWQKRGGER